MSYAAHDAKELPLIVEKKNNEKVESREIEVTLSPPDAYGHQHPIETPELVSFYLDQLDKTLDKIPGKDKSIWTRAATECPKLVSAKHKLMFLRATLFNPIQASNRLIKYWNKRFELFGEEAFEELSLSKTFTEELKAAIPAGVFRLLPEKDDQGRSVMFLEVDRHDKSKYTSKQLIRASWYFVHGALESIETQRKGVLYIVSLDRFKLSKFDKELLVEHLTSIMGVFPMRLTCLHAYNLPRWFKMFLPIVKAIIGQKLLKIHSGSQEVISNLSELGLEKKSIPSELGGETVVDHMLWIQKRLQAEEEEKCNVETSNHNISLNTISICSGFF